MADLSRYFTLPADGEDRMRIVQSLCYPAGFTAGGLALWVLARTVVPVPRSDVSHVLGDAAADYVAKKISDPVFAISDEWWIVSDPGGFGAGARDVGIVQKGLGRLLLGDPATAVCEALGVPGPAAGVAGGIAAELPLPIDRPLVFIKQLLEVGGMAVGILAGCPVLTTACCKAFLHDQLTRAAARGIHEVVREALATPDVSQPGQVTRPIWHRMPSPAPEGRGTLAPPPPVQDDPRSTGGLRPPLRGPTPGPRTTPVPPTTPGPPTTPRRRTTPGPPTPGF